MIDLFTLNFILGHINYWLFIVLMMTGLYIVISKGNLVKKIVGLNIFQSSVFMFYISMGKVSGGTAPIFPLDMKIDSTTTYSNPLPHVLILTAIVHNKLAPNFHKKWLVNLSYIIIAISVISYFIYNNINFNIEESKILLSSKIILISIVLFFISAFSVQRIRNMFVSKFKYIKGSK